MDDIEKKSPCDECPGNNLPGTCASITELGRCGQELRRKALAEYESLPKIHGWVARDMGPLNAFDLNIGKLKLWPKVPIRNNIGSFWMPDFPQDAAIMDLPEETMPELAWESVPVEVELLVRRV